MPDEVYETVRAALRALPEHCTDVELVIALNEVSLWQQMGGTPPRAEHLETAAHHLEMVFGGWGSRDAAVWLRQQIEAAPKGAHAMNAGTEQLTTSITPEMLAWLRAESRRRSIAVPELIAEAIAAYVPVSEGVRVIWP